MKAPYATPWRYIHVAKDAVSLANAQPALMDALNAPSRIADTSWIKPGKVLRDAILDQLVAWGVKGVKYGFVNVGSQKWRTWYVAGINGLERRAFTMDTSFLGAGEWKCRLFRDADPAIESGLGKVTVESVPVAPTMKVEAAARGGFAAIFR